MPVRRLKSGLPLSANWEGRQRLEAHTKQPGTPLALEHMRFEPSVPLMAERHSGVEACWDPIRCNFPPVGSSPVSNASRQARPPQERDASREDQYSKVAKLLCFTAGVAVADFEDFDLLDPGRRANFDDVALVRLHQRQRRSNQARVHRNRFLASLGLHQTHGACMSL